MQPLLPLLTRYLQSFPLEKDRLHQLATFLAVTPPGQQFHRKNFEGHITASALIVDPVLCQILLINHKSLDKWVQPGGHVDPTDSSLISAALRESQEEVGIASSELTLIHLPGEIPLDIDTHFIPERPKKREEAHYHHDFRYLFTCSATTPLVPDKNETRGAKWIGFDDLASEPTFRPITEKIKRALGVK